MELKIIRADDQLTHLALSGELNVEGTTQIEKEFLKYTAERQKPTLVDMSEVWFLSSFGIRLLFMSVKALMAVGVKMVALHPQPMVEESLRMVHLTDVIHIAHDSEEAFKLLGLE